jgi:hypothetical protein
MIARRFTDETIENHAKNIEENGHLQIQSTFLQLYYTALYGDDHDNSIQFYLFVC